MIQLSFLKKPFKYILFDAEGVLFNKIKSDADNISQILNISTSTYLELIDRIKIEHAQFILRNQLIPTLRHERYFLTNLHKLICSYLDIIPDENLISKMNYARMKGDYEMIPNVENELSILQQKYNLVVLTNSFPSRRYHELRQDSLGKYFKKLYIAYEIGIKKPDIKIFKHVLNDLHTKPNEIIFVDNNVTNIRGALQANITNVILFSQTQKSTHFPSISSFSELHKILIG